MFCGNHDHYEACGRQFAKFCEHASQLVGESSKILELPCGYGRVTRYLINSFSPANFLSKLSPDGVAVITTHGIKAQEILFSDESWFELLPEDLESLKRAAKEKRYGYVGYAPGHAFEKKTVKRVGSHYGISLIPHVWMLETINCLGFRVHEFIMGGWDNHQDVFFIGR